MLKSLLIKDVRLLSSYMMLGALLTVLAYVICFVSVSIMPEETYPSPIARTAMVLSGGSIAGLWLATFGCAMVAGNAFAAERMDRSASFLDYLPPTRKQVLLSKLLIVVGFTSLLFVTSIVATSAAWSLSASQSLQKGMLVELNTIIHVCKILTCVTGISFAISAIAKSNGAPILLGLFSPLMVLSAVKSVDFLLDLPMKGETLFPRVANACLVFGLASMFMGCRWYVSQRYEN